MKRAFVFPGQGSQTVGMGQALAGAFVAGMHYFAVDLPQQQNVQVPTNSLCEPWELASFRNCASYGSKCYSCIAIGEAGFKCEISGSDKISICESGQHRGPDCTYAAQNDGLCLVK